MRILVIMMLLALAGCGQQAGGQPPEASVEKPASSTSPIVEIRATRDGISSCGNACVVRVAGQNFVLTAWHVINEGGELSLYANGQRLNVTFGDVRHLDDAAVIPVTGNLASMDASFTMPEAGDRIEVSGVQQGKAVTLRGSITQISVRSDAPLTLGMSGAPVVVNGRVVGVSTSISTLTNADGRSNSGASHIALASIKGLF